jgi:hypothetical protein
MGHPMLNVDMELGCFHMTVIKFVAIEIPRPAQLEACIIWFLTGKVCVSIIYIILSFSSVNIFLFTMLKENKTNNGT